MRPVAVPLQLTNSPMAIATAPGVNSPNSVAAVLSTLQQLQQAANNSSLLPSSSPLKTSKILNSPSTTVSGTVTAQPLNFAPFPSKKTPLSLLLKSQAVNSSQPMIAGQLSSLFTPLIPQGKVRKLSQSNHSHHYLVMLV